MLSNNFNKNVCASTKKDSCELTLSTPNKQQKVYSFDKLERSILVESIKLYPQNGTSAESNKNLFLDKFPNTTFMTISNLSNPTLMLFCIIFLFLNSIIICSIIQEMFKKGKIIGLKNYLGNLISKDLYHLLFHNFVI